MGSIPLCYSESWSFRYNVHVHCVHNSCACIYTLYIHVQVHVHVACSCTHAQSLLNEEGLAEVQKVANQTEKALNDGRYAEATSLWGEAEDVIEKVHITLSLSG